MTDGAEFRGSGSFRVDRARALEKLSAFGFERGTDFLLPLARCAAAAEARALAVKGRTAMTASFDGRPFTRAQLVDPYAALFAEDADPAARELAVFLLAALRTAPAEISVTSGTPGVRTRLSVRDLRSESAADDEGLEWNTVVRVSWGPLGLGRALKEAKAAARAAWALTPEGFTVDGVPPCPKPAPERVQATERDGVRTVRVAPPEDPAESSVTFCVGGVAVETIRTVLPTAQVRAWVDDPRLRLTVSQSAVVEDVRREEALSAATAAAARFFEATAGRLSGYEPEGREAERAGVWSRAARAWLLDTLKSLARDGRAVPDPLLHAPVLLDALGRGLSVVALRRDKLADGKVDFSRVRAKSDRLPSPVVLVRDEEDLALLERLFPGALNDATQLIESLAKLR